MLIAGLCATAAPSFATDLGMTPSHVFGLWTNINNCLVAGSELVVADPAWRKELEAMTPQTFEGKKPSDVLQKVAEFRGKLDRMRKAEGLDATAVYGTGDGKITPTVVFLNSGHVLNGLVDWAIHSSGPEFLVSPFYTRQQFDGKTPSHVFGLVDLANRRLDAILAKSNG